MLKILVLIVIGLVLLAALFKYVRTAIEKCSEAIAGVLERIVQDFVNFADVLSEQKRRTFAVLVSDDPKVWTGARVIGSVVFGAALTAFTIAEAGILVLVFEAMGLGDAPRFAAENANLFVTITLLTVGGFLGAVFLDVIGATNLSPLGNLREPWREVVRKFTMTAIVCLLGLLFLIGAWRGLRVTPGFEFMREDLDAAIPVVAQAFATILTAAAIVLSGWSLKSLPVSLTGVALAVLEGLCRVVATAITWVVAAVDGAQKVIVAVLRIAAMLGARVYNFITAPWRKRFDIKPLDPDERDTLHMPSPRSASPNPEDESGTHAHSEEPSSTQPDIVSVPAVVTETGLAEGSGEGAGGTQPPEAEGRVPAYSSLRVLRSRLRKSRRDRRRKRIADRAVDQVSRTNSGTSPANGEREEDAA